jgi:class 3 adenylate cyclase
MSAFELKAVFGHAPCHVSKVPKIGHRPATSAATLPNGDVIEKHDVFGDGVNIAARLEQIAPPGGLCLSEDAYRQVPVMLPLGSDSPPSGPSPTGSPTSP